MGKLGITTDMVIGSICKPYLDSLEPAEGDTAETIEQKKQQKEEFLAGMNDAASDAIQSKIDEADAYLESAQTAAQNVIDTVANITIQATTIDPMAPKASAGVVASAATAVATCKSLLVTATASITALTAIIAGFLIPLPPIVTTVVALISTAAAALSAIPI